MNRAFSSLVKSLLVATLAVSGFASANEHAPAAAPAKADPAKGATLYDNGDAARGLPACVSCHGAAGNSTIATNPKLAGQIGPYIVKQLMDFTTPNRVNPIMTAYAKMLTPEDMKNVAAYVAAQAPKQGAAKNKDIVELGKKIYRGGIAATGVAACAGCHGATGSGIPALFPRLAGQHQDYTVAQLQSFKSGARKNGPMMMTIAKRMSDDEMKAVADYIAGLK
ncbi:c-type cytochrome [Massilia sp. TSP1-1-2]|uniref:c-type cytochrome n=1 Tax=unclassified Massilia TaxID=2609279 RepID=UPI003CEE2EF5